MDTAQKNIFDANVTLDDDTNYDSKMPVIPSSKKERQAFIDIRYSNPFKKKKKKMRQEMQAGKEVYNYKGEKLSPGRYQSPRSPSIEKSLEVELKEEIASKSKVVTV